MDASIAITAINAAQLKAQASVSAADLLKKRSWRLCQFFFWGSTQHCCCAGNTTFQYTGCRVKIYIYAGRWTAGKRTSPVIITAQITSCV
jgi:hypothetical protein